MSRMNMVLDRVRKVTAKTIESLRRELNHIEQEKRRVIEGLDGADRQIRNALEQLGNQTGGGNGRGGNGRAQAQSESNAPRAAAKATSKGKRIRRNPEQLKAEAEAIVTLVKSGGAEGISGPDIRKQHAKIGPDIKGFVQKYSGRKLRSTGVARSMRYFVN